MKSLPALLLAAAVATLFTAVGTRDFECYENAFVSLDRGTALASARVAGQPVYTLGIGLGTRLPLHGNLGASPAAALASALPAPATYWLLLALAVGASGLVAVRAIAPVAGHAVATAALVLLFVSVPVAAYTVYNDWPETALTYCALVAGVFAPHAWIECGGRHPAVERAGLLALVASLLAGAHPGYWPQLAAALGTSGLLVLTRRRLAPRQRWLAIAAVAAAAIAGTAIHLPDFVHELGRAAGLGRDSQGATDTLLRPHLFPFVPAGAKHPFVLLPLSLAALAASAVAGQHRAFVAGCALASIGFGLGAAFASPGTLGAGPLVPTASWTLRDPAIVFAVMGAAFAVPALVGTARASRLPAWRGSGLAAIMALAGAQGVGYTAALLRDAPHTIAPWNHDADAPAARLEARGIAARVGAAGDRVALWPGVRAEMRGLGRASTDWADAGRTLVTAWTKNRTTAGLVGENGFQFDQSLDLTAPVLCEADVVAFLRLRYLIARAEDVCPGWITTSGRVDGRWILASWVGGEDARVRAIEATALDDDLRRQPALAPGAGLVARLVPRDGSNLQIDARRLRARITGLGGGDAGSWVYVLPIAYDPGWQTSSGRVVEVGGMIGIVDAGGSLEVYFEPDTALRIRGIGLATAQVLGALGLLVLGRFTAGEPSKRKVA